jgi:hypothetical protein
MNGRIFIIGVFSLITMILLQNTVMWVKSFQCNTAVNGWSAIFEMFEAYVFGALSAAFFLWLRKTFKSIDRNIDISIDLTKKGGEDE